MEDEVAAAGMEALDEETEISVMPDAYEASDLVGVALGGVINPLGNESWDWFCFNVLAAGGMKVEMLHEATDVARHQSVQIVQEMTRAEALTKTNKDNDRDGRRAQDVRAPGQAPWRTPLEDHCGEREQGSAHPRISFRTIAGWRRWQGDDSHRKHAPVRDCSSSSR